VIVIKTNINEVSQRLYGRTLFLMNPEYVNDKLIRTLAVNAAVLTKNRIHKDGEKADGSHIGEYSNSYMKIRAKNNRDKSRKVILSLTRQMESDYAPMATPTGWGLGFKNPLNANKAEWVEDKYGDIYQLQEDEKRELRKVADKFINDLFK